MMYAIPPDYKFFWNCGIRKDKYRACLARENMETRIKTSNVPPDHSHGS